MMPSLEYLVSAKSITSNRSITWYAHHVLLKKCNVSQFQVQVQMCHFLAGVISVLNSTSKQ